MIEGDAEEKVEKNQGPGVADIKKKFRFKNL